MSSFKTRCPSCGGLNRVPNERVAEAASCGKCKNALFDGSPVEGTIDNFSALLESNTPVVVDFGHRGVTLVLVLLLFLRMSRKNRPETHVLSRLIPKRNNSWLRNLVFVVSQPLWFLRTANAST